MLFANNGTLRCNVSCANISSQDGRLYSWVSKLRYLDDFVVRFCVFKCLLVHANYVHSIILLMVYWNRELLNLTSEVSAKRFLVLFYGLACSPLNKTDLQSLDFSSYRLFVKLFRTGIA